MMRRRSAPSPAVFAAAALGLLLSHAAFGASPARKSGKLPRGGGEPGKAYLAYFAALESGDVAKVKALKLAEIEGWDDDEIRMWIPRKRDQEVQKVKVTGGTIQGDKAVLDVTAEQIGQPAWGKVDMTRAGGVWRETDARWSLVGPLKK